MDQKMHETRIKLVKSSFESRTSTSKFRHVRLNNKKGQLQEGSLIYISNDDLDRYTEIERENRILMEKMTNIYSKNNKISKSIK